MAPRRRSRSSYSKSEHPRGARAKLNTAGVHIGASNWKAQYKVSLGRLS